MLELEMAPAAADKANLHCIRSGRRSPDRSCSPAGAFVAEPDWSLTYLFGSRLFNAARTNSARGPGPTALT
jgi:hypothetical protein